MEGEGIGKSAVNPGPLYAAEIETLHVMRIVSGVAHPS
jgi:hypothetical protein